ncbi:MAG: chloride channel protein [Rhizobiaceae bacterium]|nr:chloride channel protein [Rhizobiaceae bacterium]
MIPDIIKQLPRLVYNWVMPNLELFDSSKQLRVWFASMVIGFAVSIGAIVFRELIGFVQLLWLQDHTEHVISAAEETHWIVILLAPVIGGAIVGWLLTNVMPQRRCFGVPDVIEARAIVGRVIGFRNAIWSALTTAISLGSGASAGREGPMVHLGAAMATAIARRFNLPKWADKTLLASGVAAAISASFNAPIAGVLFAHEVVLGHYSRRSFVPIVIAAAGGTIFSRMWFGNDAAFEIPAYQITSFWEFPAFALLGVVCAFVSVLFQFALVGTDYVARNIDMPLMIRPMIGGLMIGCIGIFFPHILGVGYEATDLALKNQMDLQLLLLLLVFKTAATAITLASRFGGGVFSPALYLGAMAGGAYGLIASDFFPELASSQGLYAILGMGAVAAAVLGAPFSTTMIVFELTGGYGLSIALLLAVSISTGINQAIHGHSFFEWQLEMRGLFFKDGPHKFLMRSIRVEDFMVKKAHSDEFERHKLDEDGEPMPYLKTNDSLEHALRRFDEAGFISLPVVDDTRDWRVIGNATQTAALRHFNSALVETSEEEHRA